MKFGQSKFQPKTDLMCTIRLYGPSSQQFEMLHNRIVEALAVVNRQAEIVVIQDVVEIINADVQEVPMAVVDGRSPKKWSIRTTSEEMVAQLLGGELFKPMGCKCGGKCKKRKIESNSLNCHNRIE